MWEEKSYIPQVIYIKIKALVFRIKCFIMKVHDIADGLSLCRMAGWNQLATDWEIFLHLSPNQCIVATSESKVIGTVTTIRYQKKNQLDWNGIG